MRERFERVTRGLMDADARLGLVLAEIGGADLFGAVTRHPERALNVGIREQTMIGVAAGLALAGYRPIVHTYAPFLVERPFEQIKLDLGHNGLGAVLVSVGASFDASTSGRTHQAPEDVALVSSLPGCRVDVPGHPDEMEELLRTAAAGDGLTYIRLTTQQNRDPVRLDGPHLVPVQRGDGATVVAVGPMLDPVLDAVRGMDVNVLYAATVRPFDGDTLRAVLRVPEVVMVEPYLAGTSAGVISERLRAIPHRLLSLGVSPVEQRRYGTPEQHARAHRLDARGLRQSIEAFVNAYR